MSKFKLQPDEVAAVPYSKTERDTFAAVSKTKFESTSRLLEKIHDGSPPFHGRNVLNALIRSLIRKMSANGEPFEIERSKRRGPHPMMIKIVRKNHRDH